MEELCARLDCNYNASVATLRSSFSFLLNNASQFILSLSKDRTFVRSVILLCICEVRIFFVIGWVSNNIKLLHFTESASLRGAKPGISGAATKQSGIS